MAAKLVIDLIYLPEDEKVELNYELDPGKLELEFYDFHYKSKLAIHGSMEKMANVFLMNGTLKSEVEKVCSRCLEETVQGTEEPFDLTYDIKGKTKVDVTEDLREVMILSHPLKYLCREDCKGLCAGCGANLNKEQCRCSK